MLNLAFWAGKGKLYNFSSKKFRLFPQNYVWIWSLKAEYGIFSVKAINKRYVKSFLATMQRKYLVYTITENWNPFGKKCGTYGCLSKPNKYLRVYTATFKNIELNQVIISVSSDLPKDSGCTFSSEIKSYKKIDIFNPKLLQKIPLFQQASTRPVVIWHNRLPWMSMSPDVVLG